MDGKNMDAKNMDYRQFLIRLHDDQICYLHVSPATAEKLIGRPNTDVGHMFLHGDIVYFIGGSASHLLQLIEGNDEIEGETLLGWSSIYKILVRHQGQLWLIRYPEVYQALVTWDLESK